MSKKGKEKQEKRQKKEKEFKKKQRKLAEKIVKELGIKGFDIDFIEFIPSLTEKKEGKNKLQYPNQRQISCSKMIKAKKQRLIVVVHFSENIEFYKRKLDKIMKTDYKVNGNFLIYSKKPFN
ncbi:MAG: hypothetical protein HFJ53_07035 [Clostridia bacterium]|jgi:hypothetical protein|uniref:hypothetical protein n=1 Tax=Romboutsia ilealis TaxID=1115758 RepID=UPI0026F3ECBF|nr:hypothetical protein [Romboutsia ilealis]MCI9016899.1 hypothetical protein [Clostridia bacterium]